MKNHLIITLFVATTLFSCVHDNAFQRLEMELSAPRGWKVWLDEQATWQEDTLYLPGEFTLSELPVNLPTCGWDALFEREGKPAPVPTTVEEQFGTSHDWTYHGVSWFVREFEVSAVWKGKSMMLTIPEYHQRIEVFVNEQLVGYDAVGLLPYSCDLSPAIRYGEKNRLALRIASSGGNRGWEDFVMLKWGKQEVLSAKDYSGVGGKIMLTGVDKNYISDVFIKNLLPANANNIEVQMTVANMTSHTVKARYHIQIKEKDGRKTLLNADFDCSLGSGENIVKQPFSLPEAKQWSDATPNMYVCRVTLESELGKDCYEQPFGFRVFEVKKVDGKQNFYLNDRRIRFRSAIDWGVYAFNGMFPTDEAALKTIQAVKEVGHNSLNFHRQAGDPPLFERADSLGVYMYEEPGAFHSGAHGIRNIDANEFTRKQMYERLRRMVIRDRNHPSLWCYSLSNEDNKWTDVRETALRLIHEMDDSRLIINSSSNSWMTFEGIAHFRPYEKEIRFDYQDHHTVGAPSQFSDGLFKISEKTGGYRVVGDTVPVYWGEAASYAGTFNYPLIYAQGKDNGGYDLSMYESQARKAAELFETCRLKGACDGTVETVYDLTTQAGRGQFYANGRIGQMVMSDDASDGYAINGWTPGPDMPDEWSSAMVDQNRNLNAPGIDAAWWNRPLQIAIMRQNGKYFHAGDTVAVNIYLINEGVLDAGTYQLRLRLKDGSGQYVTDSEYTPLDVKGGDTFAQTIKEGYRFVIAPSWRSGYITFEGKLMADDQTIVTSGKEQVLLQNRPSQASRFAGKPISVISWPAADQALREAGVKPSDKPQQQSLILLGKDASEQQWDEALAAAKAGANLVIQLDSLGGIRMYQKGLLKEPISVWGGYQAGHWKGTGSSYIDVFAGDQPVPSSAAISTRSWEATGDPRGFWPFRSDYLQRAYGLYFAHQLKADPNFREENNTLVTYGEIEYGKGRILLNTSYWVDADNPFADLLFFNIVEYYLK